MIKRKINSVPKRVTPITMKPAENNTTTGNTQRGLTIIMIMCQYCDVILNIKENEIKEIPMSLDG